MTPRTISPALKTATAGEPAWSLPSLREPRYSQSLERGLAILSCFTPSRPVLGIADIADELGMSRSTTHRYVITLVALGYLEQGASRKYRLGLRVTDLGMAALHATGLHEHAHPFLEELRQRTTRTAALAVLDGVEIVYVDRARSHRRGQAPIEVDLQPGSRLPAYCTALGKVLLAGLADSDLRDALAAIKPVRRGPRTITSKRALREAIESVRTEGYALDEEEFALHVLALAVPVRDEAGDVAAAICVSASTEVISGAEFVDALLAPLTASAAHISARLGYRRADERA